MDSAADPFSITYVKANRRKKEAGAIAHYPQCLQTGTRPKGEQQRKSKSAVATPKPVSWARNPNHFANATRNLLVLPSKQLRKVHIWLITEFNGKKVII
jgi:hypothetical protein